MSMNRVGRWMIAVAMGVLISGVAGCAVQEEMAPAAEEPAPVDTRSLMDIRDLSELTAEDLAKIGEVGAFVAASALVDIEIRWPEGTDTGELCNREIFVWNNFATIYPDSASGPHEAFWVVRLDENDPNLWQPRDVVVIASKSVVCFAAEPFQIHNPISIRPSGPPNQCWKSGDPRFYWDYSVELLNPECETEENPTGRVAWLDPVVVIDPGGI